MFRESVFKLELFCGVPVYGVRRLVAAFESADESARSKSRHQPDLKGGSQLNGNAARESN